jgi:hypothetical protein
MDTITSIYWAVVTVIHSSFFKKYLCPVTFYFLFSFSFCDLHIPETNKIVVQADNLWKLDDAARAAFVRTKLKLLKKAAQDQFQALIQEYQKICDESEDTTNSLKVEILRKAKVIGFTISGM